MGEDSERGKYASPEGSSTWEYLSAFFCAIGVFNLGILMGWNSPSLAELNAENSPIQMTPEDGSTLIACLAIGQMFGLTSSVFIADALGRRNSILLSTLPIMINWGMIIVAENAMVLIVARILAGFSSGLIICIYPIYMAEILSAHIRGSMGCLGIIALYCGVLFMFVVAPHLGLRITAYVCMGFTILFAICICLIPESPYFLTMVGRFEDAESALEKLRGKTDVTDDIELIKATIREKGKSLLKKDDTAEKEDSTKKQSAIKQLFTIRGNLKSFIIGLTLTTVQHLCGLGTLLNYCHIILKAIGSELDVYVASILFSTLQVISAAITVLVVDRFGRRPLLFISGIVTGSLLMIIAIYFYIIENTDIDLKNYAIFALGAILLLVMAINLGISPLPGVLTSELFATDVKMLSSCIVGGIGALLGILAAKSYLIIVVTWGFGHSVPFFGYAITTFISIAILARMLPETKGKTLLEIQKELNA